jgi:histidinol-phosphate/aromatic aminotransferase/cobyric acid decarboxylase-like protein/SAM-dependent methyltransferase
VTTPGWHRDYPRPDCWPIADWEYTQARTARELAYLVRRLPTGAAVLDAGCGLGRHTIGLARRGWPVIGMDRRADVLMQARHRSAREGARRARFVCADLFVDAPLRKGSVAAAVCIQAFGWGKEADQQALLDGLCRMLVPGGLLILDVTNPAWIVSHCQPTGTAEIDGVTYLFDCSYDVAESRSRGSVAVVGSTADPVLHDIRLYTAPEVRRLLTEAGFAVEAIDADFAAGEATTIRTRYLQFVARRRAPVLRGLAINRHHGIARGTRLDLRWVIEEPQLHARPLAELWTEAAAGTAGFEGARDYGVDDPYGAGRLTGPLRAAGLPVEPENLAAGAGVSALLAAAAGMARGKPVLCAVGGYPDLAVWAAKSGGQVTVADRVTPSAVPASGLMCLDCPSVEGDYLAPQAVRDIVRRCAERGTTLVIDESYGTYLEPDDSLTDLALSTQGTLVLAGLSKGYGLGGVRVGWAIGSTQVIRLLRSHLPPLQAASTSLAFAALVLRERGLLAPLRARVRAVKPRFVRLLAERGISARPGHPALPWVSVSAEDAAKLAAVGIAGKPGTGLDSVTWRLAVPLSDERWQLAATLLGGPAR